MSATLNPCETCGAPVDRQLPADGPLADLAARLPVVCDSCIADAERSDRERTDRDQFERDGLKAKQRLDASGLPVKYHGLVLGHLDHSPEVLGACAAWAERGGGLVLSGEIGRGKTTLAGAAAARMLTHRRVLWCSAPLLFARLGSGFNSDQRNWALEILSGSTALVVDDIDKARPTEYGAEQVFLAVDQRVEHEKPLLVTTNLTPGELAARWPEPYGEAIASRLVGYCRVVRVEGVDRRLAR